SPRRSEAAAQMARVVLEASLEVRGAIIYATLIDVATLAPILFMRGLSGALFRPLALSYGIAVMASLGVALTLTPALAMIMLRGASLNHRESPFVRWVQDLYEHLLARVVDAPAQLVSAGVAVVVLGVLVVPTLGQSL